MGGRVSRVRITGPLAQYATGFTEELVRSGYRENAVADQLRLFAHLSRWLAGRGLDPTDLSVEVADEFLDARRAQGYVLWLSRKGLAPLLSYLRALGVVPPEPALEVGPVDALLVRFVEYLVSERGLVRTTASGYCNYVRPFLRMREGPDGTLRLADLSPADVSAFVVAEAPGRRVGGAAAPELLTLASQRLERSLQEQP